MTTLAQPDLDADRTVLQIAARTNRITVEGLGRWSCAGSYATVIRGGTVRPHELSGDHGPPEAEPSAA